MNESKGIWATNEPDMVGAEQKDFELALLLVTRYCRGGSKLKWWETYMTGKVKGSAASVT